MIKERELDAIPVFNSNWKDYLLSFFLIFLYPFVFISVCIWLFKSDWNKPKHLIKMLLLIPISLRISYRLKKMKPDVVHLFWGHYPSITGFLLSYLAPKTKVTMFLGAYDLEMELGSSISLAKKVDVVFTHSEYNIDRLLNLGVTKDKLQVIYRGVDIKKLDRYCGASKNKHQLLTAGRLVSNKNFDLVIESFSRAYKLNNHLSLKIAGDGPDKTRLKNIVKELNLENEIEFTGFLTQSELLTLMGESTIFIFLSSKLGERLPNVVKEAMLARCICIVSNTPGIAELIEDRINGYILNEIVYEDVVEKITLTIKDNENKMAKFARDKIINKFDAKKCMIEYLNNWNN